MTLLAAELEELIPPGSSRVLAVGAEGAPSQSAASVDCLVLDHALDRARDPRAVLHEAMRLLDEGGTLIALVASAGNLRSTGETLNGRPRGRTFTRSTLVVLFEQSGFDVTSLRPVRDFRIPWIPLELDGRLTHYESERLFLKNLTADELEELTARDLLVTARVAHRGARYDCSLVVYAQDLELLRESLERDPPQRSFEIVGASGATYPAALNQGARTARGDDLVFLRGDWLPRPGWLDSLLACLHGEGGAGVAASLRLAPDGRILDAGFALGPVDLPLQYLPYAPHRGLSARTRSDRIESMSTASSAGMAVTRRLFVHVGGFDEHFTGSLADADLCLRVRARGRTVLSCAEAVLAGGQDTDAVEVEDRRYFEAKWTARLGAEDAEICRRDGLNVDRARSRSRQGRRSGPPPIVWTGWFLDRSGYADEARNFVLGLDRAGIDVRANPIQWLHSDIQMRPADWERLQQLFVDRSPGRFVNIVHLPPFFGPGRVNFEPDPRAVLNVGRTMWECEPLPQEWRFFCNRMDQVWVPSRFNAEMFAQSGVDASRIRRVPEALETQLFDPQVPPLKIEDVEDFVFLSVFNWEPRKGWDVLIRAFVEEFRRDEGVCLVLKVGSALRDTVRERRDRVEDFVRNVLGRDPALCPRIQLIDVALGAHQMPNLYRAADAFVLPSRGEGWGRPYMEAMAMGLPTIGTRWSGNLDFMNDSNSYLIDVDVVEMSQEGMRAKDATEVLRWGEPSVAHLRKLMRQVFEDRPGAMAKGRQAREDVLRTCSWEAVTGVVLETLAQAGVQPAWRASRGSAPVEVVWEGPQAAASSLGVVNRELCRKLVARPEVRLRIAGEGAIPGPPDPDVVVRHQWPVDLNAPPSGRWVLYEMWDFGSLPLDWLDPMNWDVDDVWVPSRWVRDCHIRSGIDPTRVTVVPYGIDPDLFRPGSEPWPLQVRGRFRFLFVGGTIAKKGADIALNAYVRAFGPGDDVCMVFKDFGTVSHYRGMGIGEAIRKWAGDPSMPEIAYLEHDTPQAELPGLYAAVDCLVQPYRGESFCLAAAEGMACGLPVILPRYGPCLDYCDDTTALLVPAPEMRLSEKKIDVLPTSERPYWCEPDLDALAAAMRWAYEHRSEAREIGRRASERVRNQLTWERAAEVAATRLRELADRPSVRTARSLGHTLSVCLITKNEEKLLGHCLESVRGLADEVVVVDTGSSDRTVEIARERGARVFQIPWPDSFGAARNEAIKRATKDWILMLDADHEVDPASHQEIRRLIATDRCVGYLLRQLNYTEPEGETAVFEHLNLRLFPNHPAIRYVGRYHEQVRCHQPELGFHSVPSRVILHHPGSRPQHSGSTAKVERYLHLIELDQAENPEEPFHAYNLGFAHLLLGNHVEGERWMRRCIELWKPYVRAGLGHSSYLASAYARLAWSLGVQGRHQEAVDAASDAVGVDPGWLDGYATLGDALFRAERLDEALAAYREAYELRDSGPAWANVDRSPGGWRAMLSMAEVLLAQERWGEAHELLVRVNALTPGRREVLERISRCEAQLAVAGVVGGSSTIR